MNGWKGPGDGWRQVPTGDVKQGETIRHRDRDGNVTWWQEEPPAPVFPTEAYTVIRVTWKIGRGARNDLFMLLTDRHLNDRHWRGETNTLTQRELVERVDAVEVLAEPCDLHYGAADLDRTEERVRRETARAVLDRIYGRVIGQDSRRHEIAREFGVEP